MQTEFDAIVVGAGIVGLATARRLQALRPHWRLAVLDKEPAVGAHQSGHNSGVIHAGVYYPPGSLKAAFCRRGAAATLRFCADHGIAHRQCGKLIVATERSELTRLRALAERAAANGLRGQMLDAAAIAEREPSVRGVGALYVPETGIADYPAMCAKLAELFVAAGGTLICGATVDGIDERSDGVSVESTLGTWRGGRLVVCAGLQADRLARLAGLAIDFAILPFRGDYYRLPAARGRLVSTLIYPVPDPRLPFLGVHLTVTTAGAITVGPTAMLALAREAYRKWGFDWRDCVTLAGYPGTWRLLSRFPRAGALEFLHAVSRRLYLRAAQRYCPQLDIADLADHECGIRAQAVNRRGELINDFLIEQTPRSVHVCNAPSPAATAAFPIAETIAERLLAS
ncbi:MAG: L-2-hydroxyglutarate oxidase [Gammaproteobacteria bacterium]